VYGGELLVGLLPEKLKDLLHNDEKLWQRNLLIISFAVFASSAGMSSIVPFFPFYIRQLGVTDLKAAQLWSGLIYAGPFLSALIAVPIWGSLADRYGRKTMMVRANLGLGIAMLLMSFSSTPLELFLARVLQGAISGFIAASLGFTASNTPKDKSGFALGFITGAQNAGNILGPFIGGIVSDTLGIHSVFYIVSSFCFIAFILIFFFLQEKNFKPNRDKKVSVLDNIKYTISKPILISLLLMMVVSQAGMFLPTPIFAFFVESLNPPKYYISTITGALVAIVGFCSVLTAPFWGRLNDKKPFYSILIIAGLISSITLAAHPLVGDFYQLFGLRLISGLFLAAIIPTIFAAINKNIPLDRKGGIMALASGASYLGNLISYLSAGAIASNFGMQYCFYASGILLLSVSLIGFREKRKAK
jgi:DHA1 family multidrug resistance protein-like MFS transporter